MIIPVIMAGGVGSRLWPLSRESYPKQFISFQGEKLSLFQESLSRLSGLADVASPIVVCNQEHRFIVAEQLRQIGIDDATIMLEPVGRNTAPAIAMAALEASGANSNDSLLVLAADHVIQNISAFHQAISIGQKQVDAEKLATFGIVPTSAEIGYGYICRGKEIGEAFEVENFEEKPSLDKAEAFLASGSYYWNSGMFMFSAKTYLQELGEFAPKMLSICKEAFLACDKAGDFTSIPENIFACCPADSIDYAVMEKTGDAVVVPLDAGWNDLGAWGALWEQGDKTSEGNVLSGDTLVHDVKNSLIHAESKLVSVVGIDDVVVVETKDAVLVSSREKVQNVKEIVNKLKQKDRSEAALQSVVRRPWGSYEGIAEDDGFQVKRIIVQPGASLSLQLHHQRSEHWIVVRGLATVTCGENVFELKPNESTYIPVESKHRLENFGTEPVILIEVQCGSYLGEDDIVRFEDIYGREE